MPAAAAPATDGLPAAADAGAAPAAAGERISFVANRGQWPLDVRFAARLGGVDLWVTDDGITYDFHSTEEPERTLEGGGPPVDGPELLPRRGQVVRVTFDGARAAQVTGRGLQAAYHNYYLGSDPSRWAAHVPLYDEVLLENLYDGVDLRLYDDGGFPRYDLLLAPGAELGQVRMRLDGADDVSLTPAGAVRMDTSLGPVEQRGLVAYQHDAEGARRQVPSAFRINPDGTLGFTTAGADPARPLVVDPLLWSTFLGGGRADLAAATTVGPNGTVTVAGSTGGQGFPTTTGSYDVEYNGLIDAFVTGLTAGGQLRFSTFLGGSDADYATGAATGPGGATTVTGDTDSADFPVTAGAYDTSFNTADAFVARLSFDGSALGYASYLGGSRTEFARAVAVGSDGSATVTGSTYSEDFPTTGGSHDASYDGGGTGASDGFVTRLSPNGSALRYSTYLGGTGDDDAFALAVDGGGTTTVVGYTFSSDFQTTPGAYDRSYNGVGQFPGTDAFVTRLAVNGQVLLYSTFLGGTELDAATGVALTPDGAAVVTGYTAAGDFPTTPGAFDTTHGAFLFADAFVTRLSVDGSSLRYSTFLGGTGYDYARGMALGPDTAVTVVGETEAVDFPTTPGADGSYNGGGDAFVARLSADGAALRYGTYFGGATFDSANAVALAADGSAAVVGSTFSADFRTTPGAGDVSYNGRGDAFIARFGAG